MTPTSGWMDGALHRFPLRVYYEDTDAAGIVYYANYLKFVERARTEFLRQLGVDQSQLRQTDGVFFAVRRAEIEYLRPARLDDCLEVRTCLTGVGGSVIDARQGVYRDEERLAEATMRVVCLSAGDGKPTRIPSALRAAWLPFVTAT